MPVLPNIRLTVRIARSAFFALWLAASALPGQVGGASGTPAGADSLRAALEEASANGNLASLRVARVKLDRAIAASPNDQSLLYSRGYAAFREVGLLMATNRASEASETLGPGIEALERAVDRSPSAEAYALLSALYGQKIGVSGSAFTAIRLGPGSMRTMDRAMTLGPKNPRVWLLKGISTFNMPSLFGGGAAKAESQLRMALSLFAAQPHAPNAPTWGEGDTWLWLGRVLQQTGKPGEARLAYGRAAELQPWNIWLTQSLIPSLPKERAPESR